MTSTKSPPPPEAADLAAAPEPIVITQYQVLVDDIHEAEADAPSSFDYADKAGEKAARSYIHKMRGLKGRIEPARKDAKSWALAYGRTVDERARELTTRVVALIEPHETQLNAIAEAEARRVQAHQAVLNRAEGLGRLQFGASSAEIRLRLENVDAITLDGLEEFAEKVAAAVLESRHQLQAALETAELAEQQAAELAQLRRQQAREREELRRQEEAEERAEQVELQELQEQDLPVFRVDPQAEARPAAAPAAAPAGPRTGVPGTFGRAAPVPLRGPWFRPSKRYTLAAQIHDRLSGMDREQVARAIVEGSLHPAISVDWEKVQ